MQRSSSSCPPKSSSFSVFEDGWHQVAWFCRRLFCRCGTFPAELVQDRERGRRRGRERWGNGPNTPLSSRHSGQDTTLLLVSPVTVHPKPAAATVNPMAWDPSLVTMRIIDVVAGNPYVISSVPPPMPGVPKVIVAGWRRDRLGRYGL